MPHLFEFMDETWVPKSLRDTLRDAVEMVCSPPIRPYDPWVAELVRKVASENGCRNIVELGAGTAPVTRILAGQFPQNDTVRLIPCDLNPDSEAYRLLERQFPERVRPIYEPVDITEPRDWPPGTLVFISATMHHIPRNMRARVLRSVTESADQVLIVEPLRKTPFAVTAVSMDWLLALLLPIRYLHRPGRARRLFWSWVLPLAPPAFTWDAIVSCLRQWTEREWRVELEKLGLTQAATIEEGLLSQSVVLQGRSTSASQTTTSAAETEILAHGTV